MKQYTPKLKQLLVFDRVSEAIQIFCANNTIDEVNMNVFFLNDMKNVFIPQIAIHQKLAIVVQLTGI